MRKVLVLLTAALMVLSATGLALAQTQTTPPTTATPAAAKLAAKAAGVRHMLGEVVWANTDTKTLTVKHTSKKKIKELTFSLTGDAALHVMNYKPGDSVRVTYVDEAGKLIAQSVTPSKKAAKK